MKLKSLLVCGALLAGLSGFCLAAPDDGARTVPEILQMQHQIRTKLESRTGEYSRFDASQILKMETAQDTVFRLLDGVTSLDQLNETQRIEVSNALDQVKATLLANEGSRVICHMERKTGTNLTTRQCRTVAGRQADQEEAQRRMFTGDIGR
jgi:hypothetical protein